jgi:hypothetical protein
VLKVEREGDVFTVISDDENAENVAIGEALENAAPHLLESYEATDTDGDGTLRWPVRKEDWRSLAEAIEIIEGVNPEEQDQAATQIMLAVQESDEA